MLSYPPSRERELRYHPDGRRKLLSAAESHAVSELLIHYYALCKECLPQVTCRADITRLRAARPTKQRARFAYPCIGGPLDGEYATTSDFYCDGMYAHLDREYEEYNAARATRRVLGAQPSMVFIHKAALKPLARPAER